MESDPDDHPESLGRDSLEPSSLSCCIEDCALTYSTEVNLKYSTGVGEALNMHPASR